MTPDSTVTGGVSTHTASTGPAFKAQEMRGKVWRRAKSVSLTRSWVISGPSVRSSRSAPLSSRLTTTEASRRTALRLDRTVRSGAIRANSAGCSTAHSVRSTISVPRMRCRPTLIVPVPRRAARSMRRRVRGATGRMGAMGGASNPARRSAAVSRPRFQSRYAAWSQCCDTQPPQTPKWTQTGARRSGPGSSTASSSVIQASPCRVRGRARTRSPGTVRGT